MNKPLVDPKKVKIPSAWDQIENGKEFYLQTGAMREALKKYFEKRKLKESINIDDYDNPSWSHKQAHRNGYNQAIREIMVILGET